MKNSWMNPPKNKGWNSNKKMILQLKQMAMGLVTLSKDEKDKNKLKLIASELKMVATLIERRVDAYPNIYDLWTYLCYMRNSLLIKEGKSNILKEIEEEIASLKELASNSVLDNPNDRKMNHSLSVFMRKEKYVERICLSAEKSLKMQQKKYESLDKDKEKIQLTLCSVAIDSFTQIRDIMVSIKENLKLLEFFCEQSHSLCRRVSRLINTKKMSNFIDQPKSSLKEAIHLHAQLIEILENIKTMHEYDEVCNDLKETKTAEKDTQPGYQYEVYEGTNEEVDLAVSTEISQESTKLIKDTTEV